MPITVTRVTTLTRISLKNNFAHFWTKIKKKESITLFFREKKKEKKKKSKQLTVLP